MSGTCNTLRTSYLYLVTHHSSGNRVFHRHKRSQGTYEDSADALIKRTEFTEVHTTRYVNEHITAVGEIRLKDVEHYFVQRLEN